MSFDTTYPTYVVFHYPFIEENASIMTHTFNPEYLDARQNLYLSIEALAVETNIFLQGTSLLKGLMGYVQDTFKFSSTLTTTDDLKPLSSDQKKFVKLVDHTPYASMTGIKAYVPEGMHSTYLDYMKTLVKLVDHIKTVEKDTLDPYLFYLGQFISNKDTAASIHNDGPMFKKQDKVRQDLYLEVAHHFTKSSHEAQTTLGQVIHRNNDWTVTFKELQKLIDGIESVNRRSLQAKINQGCDYVKVIVDQYSKDATSNVSKQAAQKLADYTYSVAKELEMYADVHYRILALRGSIDNTMQTITEIFG